MPIDKRTFIIDNQHRNENSDVNNDITITLPDSIFSGKVEAINMKHMYIDYATETLGTSNYEMYIQYPETATATRIRMDITSTTTTLVQTDNDLAALMTSSINSTLGTTAFYVYFNEIITSTNDIYRDNSNLLGSYTITTTNNTNFTMDFSSKVSIGPMIGFGNGTYSGASLYKGGNIPPLFAYESIHIMNKAFDPIYKQYDISTDIACKMDLYDSSNNLIPNSLDARDTTISLPIMDGYITNVNEFITYLTTELNSYSSSFASNPTFSVSYDYSTDKFTITNDKAAVFGIGFRFNRSNGNNNYGSLHRQLGFDKNIYLGYTSITSIHPAKIFGNAYISEYLFVCSDLIKYNYDAGLIVAESGGLASMYESIFTIPSARIVNYSYVPAFDDEHRTRIHASKLAKLYNENMADDKTINFYLRLSSGRHIKLNTQWSIKFEIEYIN
jgi:hypothetical protein